MWRRSPVHSEYRPRGADDIAVLQSEVGGRCVRACLVEHGDRASLDGHLPHGLYILPIQIHAVGDEVAMAVSHVDVGDRGQDCGRSSRQRDALNRRGPASVVGKEVSPERAADLGIDDVTKAGEWLRLEQDFLAGHGALSGSPDTGRCRVVVGEVEVACR